MRCVLCGGPFGCPTACDRVTAGLSGPAASFKWLRSWSAISAKPDKRRRGEPPAFYAHSDCLRLLQLKLDVTPHHSQLWAIVKDSAPSAAASSSSADNLLPASAYAGMAALLDPNGNRCSSTMLSATHFNAADSWMLHSPLVCSMNAQRVLTIWGPKLDVNNNSSSDHHSLVRGLSSLLLQAPRAGPQRKAAGAAHRPGLASSSGGTSTEAGPAAACADVIQDPDVLAVLLSSRFMHEPAVLAKLHMCTSNTMNARVASALAGRLHLCFSSSSTETVVSLSLWLAQHAGLLATLELDLRVACCDSDEAAADAAISNALMDAHAAVADAAAHMRWRCVSFRTTCSRPQLLTSRSALTLPCLAHLTHLTLPDLSSDQQVRCLPTKLSSLDLTRSTSDGARLRLVSQQCPGLREVRLGYSLWPSRTNHGCLLLDCACAGWELLPIVEMRFVGCRLPRGFAAQSTAEPPYLSKAALGQLPNLSGLTRLLCEGCCVDAPVRHFASVLSRLSALRALDLAEPSGVLTAEPGNAARCFIDSTAALLQAASRRPGRDGGQGV